jgi:hypothetical protein
MTLREHLASWALRATPIAELLDQLANLDALRDPELLFGLVARVARSVLVEPDQPVGDVTALVERVAAVDTLAARLAALDLLNALACAGATTRPGLDEHVRRGLAELASAGPPLALRMHVGLAAIVYGELDVAARIALEVPELYFGDEQFPNNVLALLGYLVKTTRAGSVAGVLDVAWERVAEDLVDLCASGQLDELAVLWLARVVYAGFARRPLASVATDAHDHLWRNRPSAVTTLGSPDFPLTDTLGGGAYRVERHVLGRGAQTLWLGREVASGARVFISCDVHNSDKQDLAALRRAVGYRAPGVFELAYAGTFDTSGTDRGRDALRAANWAIVESVPAGSWLPWTVGAADPWSAPTKAVELGRSAGRILITAAGAGIDLARIRPELMWAQCHEGHFEVTGLSPRAIELFARKVGEMVTYPLFDRFYHAPEVHKNPDDRAIAYSLAVMIAEWATGRYPFNSRHAPDGVETGAHEPIAAPRPLAQLLEATIRRDRSERPSLAEFVDALERLTL